MRKIFVAGPVLALALVFGPLALAQQTQAPAAPAANQPAKPADPAKPAAPAKPVEPAKPADPAPAAAAAPAPATPPPPAKPPVKRVKMRTLLTNGYQVRAVTFVPQDASTRVAKMADNDAALVTLQKGPAAATCFISLEEYISPGMTDIQWCIEHN